MSKRVIGNYRIVRWHPLSPVGIPGWFVIPKNGTVFDHLSKHASFRDAVAAAKRYTEGDKRRAR
jgi:hypothetical protein